MKFVVSSTALFSHLQAISRVINSKNSLPILDCFLMELNDGTLSITASDSETTLVTRLEVSNAKEDAPLLPWWPRPSWTPLKGGCPVTNPLTF